MVRRDFCSLLSGGGADGSELLQHGVQSVGATWKGKISELEVSVSWIIQAKANSSSGVFARREHTSSGSLAVRDIMEPSHKQFTQSAVRCILLPRPSRHPLIVCEPLKLLARSFIRSKACIDSLGHFVSLNSLVAVPARRISGSRPRPIHIRRISHHLLRRHR